MPLSNSRRLNFLFLPSTLCSLQDICLSTERKFTIKDNVKCFQSTLKDYLLSKTIVLKEKNFAKSDLRMP